MFRTVATIAFAFALTNAAVADDSAFEMHAQATYVWQHKPSFVSPYQGPRSLGAASATSYTLTGTVYLGARIGSGTEIYFNPEFVQGVPFSQLQGSGGFPNGEIQRTTGPVLKGYAARLFLRQTWNIGGEIEEQASEQNQVRTRYTAERLVATVGTISLLDVFDAVDYSRDARTQFMNWASLTYGAWDFPADARGYTWGAALEYMSPAWSVRAGRFAVPVESNGLRLHRTLNRHYGDVIEGELPYAVFNRSAILRILAFRNREFMGAFDDALAQGAATGATPDLTQVRRLQSKRGFGIGTQVEVTKDIAAYARAGWNDGKTETYAFTEIDRSLAAGVLLKGERWGRSGDSLGFAGYINALSRPHRSYLAVGGQGFFLGEGRLNYGTENIFETFYSWLVAKQAWFSLGYQHMAHPGYNRDRGPADFFGFRMHAEL